MKKYLIQFLGFLALVASVAYLIPNTELNYKGNIYTFNNLPSLDKKDENLNFDIATLKDYYKYKVESAVKIDDIKGWNNQISEDQKTLERRVESLVGSAYEVRLDKVDNKALFTIMTSRNLGKSAQVLANSNAELKISAQQTTIATLDGNQSEQTPTTSVVDLNLKRADFGVAEINVTDGTTGQELEVRLPIGLIGPEKIKEINNRAPSTLDIMVGNNKYTGGFVINPDTYSITHLKIGPVTNIIDALSIKALLNTGNYNLGYNLVNSGELVKNDSGILRLGILSIIFIIGAILINKISFNNLSLKKGFYMIFVTILGLALTKFFGVNITDGYIIWLAMFILLTIFSTWYLYYLLIIGVLLITKLLGYLYYLNLSWNQILLLTIISIALWSGNYIKKVNKKYA